MTPVAGRCHLLLLADCCPRSSSASVAALLQVQPAPWCLWMTVAIMHCLLVVNNIASNPSGLLVMVASQTPGA